LVLYATIAEMFEKNEEALHVLLRLVVSKQDHKPAKALLAKVRHNHDLDRGNRWQRKFKKGEVYSCVDLKFIEARMKNDKLARSHLSLSPPPSFSLLN
jgi:hypothetical protein